MQHNVWAQNHFLSNAYLGIPANYRLKAKGKAITDLKNLFIESSHCYVQLLRLPVLSQFWHKTFTSNPQTCPSEPQRCSSDQTPQAASKSIGSHYDA